METLTLSLRVLQISDTSEASSAAKGFLHTVSFWCFLSRNNGADLMNGLAFLCRNLGSGGERGDLTWVGVSERISLTISSSGRGWLGGGDLLMPPCLEVEMWEVGLRGGFGLLLVLTQQPIEVSGGECGWWEGGGGGGVE